jgi:drug/metabolite transporter (DMT)-like permease
MEALIKTSYTSNSPSAGTRTCGWWSSIRSPRRDEHLWKNHTGRYDPRMPYLSFAFVCVVWGSSFILMKKGAMWFSPTSIGAWRLIAGAAVLAFVGSRLRRPRTVGRRDLGPIVFVALFGFVWPFWLQPWLVARDGSGFIGMMVSFTPLLTIAASIPLLGIYPARRQFLGVLGALGFMALLMVVGRDRGIPLADLGLGLTVPLCYAITNTVIRRSLSHLPPLELSLVCLLTAGMILLPISLVVPFERESIAGADRAIALGAVLFLGVVGTGIGTLVFTRLIQEQGPLFAGMVTNLVPIGAVLFAWVDGEPVSFPQVVALVGLVSMVSVVQFGAARPASRRDSAISCADGSPLAPPYEGGE